jgi:MoaA/NifB/PqqE/SkfB family radical SAM enzyme
MAMSCDILKKEHRTLSTTEKRADKFYAAGMQLERGLELRQIDSVRKIAKTKLVYNFSCSPIEAYEANGFVVHNCVYAQSNRKEIPATEDGLDHIISKMHEDMNEADVIPTDKMLEVLDDFKEIGVRAVTYSGGGEPLMHRDIVLFMERTLQYGIDLSIITNGQLLRGRRAEVLAAAKWVRVSVDYTTAGQMALSRRVPERLFDEVLDNIRQFAKIKQPACDLGVNYIIHRQNYHGLVPFTKALKDCGVTNVRFSPMWMPDFINYHAPIKDEVGAQLREAQKLVDHAFTVNSTFDLGSSAHLPNRSYTRCFFMQMVPVIGADQKVYACHNKAYDHTGCLGSIADKRFKDLWFSNETKRFFETLNPMETCRHQCANDSKNRNILNLIDAHIDNFV